MPTFTPCTITDIPALLAMMEAYYAFDHIPFDKAKAEYAVKNIIADSRLGFIRLIHSDEYIAG